MRLESVILEMLPNPQANPSHTAFISWIDAPILDALGEGDTLRLQTPSDYLALDTLEFETDGSNSFEIVKFWAGYITSRRAAFSFRHEHYRFKVIGYLWLVSELDQPMSRYTLRADRIWFGRQARQMYEIDYHTHKLNAYC